MKNIFSIDETNALINLGNKFQNLCLLSKDFHIPYAVCIGSSFLNNLFFRDPLRRERLHYLFLKLKSTSANELSKTHVEIESIARSFRFTSEDIALVAELLSPYVGKLTYPVALRSSASHEDSANSSFAGVYKSVLHISSFRGMIQAMEELIRQYFSLGAIAARLKENNCSELLELNIIVQNMVSSHLSGVCFSLFNEHRYYVEWVYGFGETLVSGDIPANHYINADSLHHHDAFLHSVLKDVQRATKQIRCILNCEVDVEWAHDEQNLYILQARPITVLSENFSERKPLFLYDALYFENRLQQRNLIFDCADVYHLYMEKRAKYYVLAKSQGLSSIPGYLITFNLSGLRENKKDFKTLYTAPDSNQIILDINSQIRQVILKKEALIEYLFSIFSGDEYTPHSIILRHFMKGDYGCVSRIIGNNQILIECADAGLLALNRGLTVSEQLITDFDGHILQRSRNLLPQHCVNTIATFTRSFQNMTSSFLLEWLIKDNLAFFTDYSTEGPDFPVTTALSQKSALPIVSGNVAGKIYKLSDIDLLTELSVSPGVSIGQISDKLYENPDLFSIIQDIQASRQDIIVYADRPYAILTFLFDYVTGFIFKEGSLLCHLSIMLRECRKPSYIYSEIDSVYPRFPNVMIVNGEIVGYE